MPDISAGSGAESCRASITGYQNAYRSPMRRYCIRRTAPRSIFRGISSTPARGGPGSGSAAGISACRGPDAAGRVGPAGAGRAGARSASGRPGGLASRSRVIPMSVLTTTQTDLAYQQCLNPACRTTLAVDQVAFACPECGDLLDVVYDWDRLPVPRRLSDFQAKWADRLDPLNFSGVWRFRELLPFAPPDQVVTIGEGQTLLQVGRQGRPVRRHESRPAPAPVRGDEPLGELQGQRDDRRVHPRPDGQRPPGRLRQHRQHLGGPGGLLLGHAVRLQGDHLHRLGQDRLRQAGPGARPRRPDDPDRRRLRRRHAPGPPGGRPARHLPDELGQPVPPRRPEDDHVPGPGGPRPGSRPTGSSSPAATWATPAPSARRSSS